jgi:chemotaxis signal transduction protein
MDRLTLLTFSTSGRRLALPLADVRRVVALPALEAPAGAPGFVEGFFDYQGVPVAALRLDRLLSLGEEELGVYSALLVLTGAAPVALHVARVETILKTTAAEVQPIGREETFNACVVGRLGEAGQTRYLLSAEDILLTEERASLAAFRAMRQQRLAALEGEPADAA